MSVERELGAVGQAVVMAQRRLDDLRGHRRALILKGLAGGMSEREVATLARCAPSYVHRVAEDALGR